MKRKLVPLIRNLSGLQIVWEGKPATVAGASQTAMTRRLVKICGFFAATLLIVWMTGIAGAVSDRLVFYGRIARLYTQEPESKIVMPFKDVTKKQIANTWGAPRGEGRRHEGQDIFAPRGTPILSATSGYVYKIGENNLGGQTVSVISKGGRVYYYAHLDSYAPGLEVGDPVSTRTVLGFVGTTGNAQGTPPHLHFGVYTMTGAINPLPLLTDRTTPAIKNKPQETRAKGRLVSRKASA